MKSLCDGLGIEIPEFSKPSISLRSVHTQPKEKKGHVSSDDALVENFHKSYSKYLDKKGVKTEEENKSEHYDVKRKYEEDEKVESKSQKIDVKEEKSLTTE